MTTAKPAHNSNRGKTFRANYLMPAEAQAIFDACRDTPTGIRNRALLVLMYRSGLRVGEALSLETGSIYLETGMIRVPKTKIGRAQTRYFLPEAEDDLKRWMKKREELGVRPGAIFCRLRRPAGGPLETRQIRTLTEDLAKKAEIHKRVNPHIFRHSFAMELYLQNVDLIKISKLLGHTNPAYTMTYLDHLTNGEVIRGMNNLYRPSLDNGKPAQVSQPEDLFDDYDDYEQW